MMIKTKFKIMLVTLLAFFSVVSFAPVYAQNTAVCDGAQAANASVNCTDKKLSDNAFGNIIRSVVDILSVVVGAVSVIMIIIGGFRYVVSNGDSNGISGAKNTILYAIIGLVVVLFAQVIVRFVISGVKT